MSKATTASTVAPTVSLEKKRAHVRLRQEKRERDVTAAKLVCDNIWQPKKCGALRVYSCGYFFSKDVDRWVELDPTFGVLSIWHKCPPDGFEYDPAQQKKRQLWHLCFKDFEIPTDVYKLFDLEEVDANHGFWHIFLKFRRRGTLLLTASSDKEFADWLGVVMKYVPAGKGTVASIIRDGLHGECKPDASTPDNGKPDDGKPDDGKPDDGRV